MQLHWSPRSPFVRKVTVCAHELGLSQRITLQRSVAAMLQPNAQIMRDNPLNKIPTLVLDDGSSLFDSAVICEYLDAMAGGNRLFPTASALRWQALRWQALGDGLLDILLLWRHEREREVPVPALIEAFETKLRASLVLLDGEAELLERAEFSIGQVTVACTLGYIDYRFGSEQWREKAPRLHAWHDIVRRRPSLMETEPRES